MPKKLALSAIFALFTLQTWPQQKSDYIFYTGDTLLGYNQTEAVKQMEVLEKEHHLNNVEKQLFLLKRQRTFVENKYKLSLFLKGVKFGPPTITILSLSCNNSDFETGDFTGWSGGVGYNNSSSNPLTISNPSIQTLGTNTPENSCSYQTLLSVAGGQDPYGHFSVVPSGGGSYTLRLGGDQVNINSIFPCATGGPGTASGGEIMEQHFIVTKATSLYTYRYAVVLQDGGHHPGEQPYFSAEVLDSAGNDIACKYFIQCTNGVPPAGFQSDSTVFFLNWTSNSFNLAPYIGQPVTIRFTAAGCIFGGHFGYAYIDCSCSGIEITEPPPACQSSNLLLSAPPGTSGYFWEKIPPGPGIVGSNTNQLCYVDKLGHYRVTVTSGICTYSVDTIVTSLPQILSSMVPNVFTPNGDGANDVFRISENDLNEFSIKIFNRWGNIVFDAQSSLASWDGKSKNVAVTDGVYYWVAQYRDCNGHRQEQAGFLHLMR
jgi:gliding motility-associated-like protein